MFSFYPFIMCTFYFKFLSTFLTYYFMFFFHNNCWTGRIRTAVAEAQNLQFCVIDHSTTVQYNFISSRSENRTRLDRSKICSTNHYTIRPFSTSLFHSVAMGMYKVSRLTSLHIGLFKRTNVKLF